MRYVYAMLAAIILALIATVFVSGTVANMVVDRYEFDSPDTVADLHAAVFMGCNIVALLIGWAIGWIIGGRLVHRAPVA
jgi:vancomycin permeability regulator SanA